jgi:predicted transcriptional regulator
MFELSHPERLKILNILKEESMRLSDISKTLDVTTAEVSRHLERLGKAKLLERDPDNHYNLTPFGNIILSELSKFDFLTQNKEYFLKHDLTPLPSYLHWFNSMAEGELIEGTLEISSLIKDFSVKAKEYIHVISDEVMRGMVDIDCKKCDEGVMVKKIYPAGAEIPPEYEARIGENLHIRILDEIPLALKITEENAGVVLLATSGKMDFSVGILGEKEPFRRWVATVFDFYWDKAKQLL